MGEEEARKLAEENNFMFVETSAFANTNVNTAFETLMNSIHEVRQRMQTTGKYAIDRQKEILKLHDPDLENKNEGCC